MIITKKQFAKAIKNNIEIVVEYPMYDGDLYEAVEFEKEVMIDDNHEMIIKGFANFKFDSTDDEIFGRECEHQHFDIDEIKVYNEDGEEFTASEFQKKEIKKMIFHYSI